MSVLRKWFTNEEIAGSGAAEGAASRLDREEVEEVIAEAERACGEAFGRIAETRTPATLAWAEAANPEALAAYREAERRAMSLPPPATPEELAELKAALAEMEAAWERARSGYPGVQVLARPEDDRNVEIVQPGEAPGGGSTVHEATQDRGRAETALPVRDAGGSPGAKAGGTARGAAQLSLFPPEPEPGPGPAGQPFRSSWEDWLQSAEIVRVPGLSEWREALAEARAAGVCGLDTETTGIDPLQNRIRLVQVAVPVYPEARRLVASDWRNPEPGGGCRVYILDLFGLSEPERREALEALAGLVADSGVIKIGHHLKFDLAFLRAALGGKRLACERLFDTMLASQLITAGDFVPGGRWEGWCRERGLRPAENERGQELKTRLLDAHGHLVEFEHDNQKEIKPFYPTHSLQQVAHRHLEVWLDKELQASDWAAPELSEKQIAYAARDAAVLLPLREVLREALIKNRLAKTAEIEFACLPAVAEVELAGMPFDAGRARELLREVEDEAARRREVLELLASGAAFRPRPKKSGRKRAAGFNPDSGIDCADCLRLLAEAEGVLAEGGRTLAAGGEEMALDTRDETLARLAARLPEESALRRFAEELRAYRAAKKRADFLKKWLELLHPATDRLHPDLRQVNPYGVGRFSASSPNLQQVVRGSDIRSLFRAPAGRKLAVADFSGIEMRIMAQLSGDATLTAVFKEGADVHRRTGAFVSGKREEEVTKEERQAAKAAGFGLIYGMTAETLRRYAETGYGVKLTPEEAERMREAFFRAYPGVAAWHARQDRRGFEDGFEPFWRHDFGRGFYREPRPCVRTLGGRLRVWPVVERERRDGNGTYLRKAGPFTELYNTPDQGTGADMIKCAMARLYRELLRRGWEDVKFIGTVHDEILLECPEKLAVEAAELLGSVMELTATCFLREVPVEVEVMVCNSWAEK